MTMAYSGLLLPGEPHTGDRDERWIRRGLECAFGKQEFRLASAGIFSQVTTNSPEMIRRIHNCMKLFTAP